MSARSVKVSSFLAIVALCSASLLLAEASAHQYPEEKFGIKGNAFVVHGGSEGIYSSDPTLNDSSPADSFIRYTTFAAFFSFSLRFHILFFICENPIFFLFFLFFSKKTFLFCFVLFWLRCDR